MRQVTKHSHGSIICKPTQRGLSIEEEVRRAIATNTPLEGKQAPIFTPAKDGVLPQYNPRTDKHDIALQAMDKYQKSAAMKGQFITETEYDENGDGKGNKPTEENRKEE